MLFYQLLNKKFDELYSPVNFMDKLSIIIQSCQIHVDLKRDGGVWKFILL